MRRIRRDETLHGTRDGQVAVDRALAEAHRLTEREAVCAALVKDGLSRREIADALGISSSTAEKHLAALRRKLGVATTREAALRLLRSETNGTARIAPGFGPVPGFDAGIALDAQGARFAQLRRTPTLEGMVGLALASLQEDGAGGLFYYYLPLSAASLRKGEVVLARAGAEELSRAFDAHGGWAASGIAGRLFAEPDDVIVLDADDPATTTVAPASLIDACRAAGLRYGITLGAPFGVGYVACSALFHARPADSFRRGLDARVANVRQELRLVHNAAFAFGALAREAALTIRERDALTLLAEGQTSRSAAAGLGISERAFGQLAKSARTKLRAASTTEAVAKAMALNALVFL